MLTIRFGKTRYDSMRIDSIRFDLCNCNCKWSGSGTFSALWRIFWRLFLKRPGHKSIINNSAIPWLLKYTRMYICMYVCTIAVDMQGDSCKLVRELCGQCWQPVPPHSFYRLSFSSTSAGCYYIVLLVSGHRHWTQRLFWQIVVYSWLNVCPLCEKKKMQNDIHGEWQRCIN